MPVRDLSELGPEARAAVESYLNDVAAGLCSVDPDIAGETLDALREHLLEALDADATEAQAAAAIAVLGEPDTLTMELCESMADAETHRRGYGRILGMPYDLRFPTPERVASRWWNPRDPRVFVPRVFGIGWDLNFGALAVLLHLIEPDAEDEPFAEVPDRTFFSALMVPVALTAAMLASYLALRSILPAELPVHWNWRGLADRSAPAGWAFSLPFGLALVSTVWALWSVALRRHPLSRGALIGLASFLSSLGCAIWGLTLLDALGGEVAGWVFPAAIVASMAVPLAVLTALARAGRATEQRRDLGEQDK